MQTPVLFGNGRCYRQVVRKLGAYLGIALAVALGVALAPYLWRVLGIAALLTILACILVLVSVAYVLMERSIHGAWRWWLSQGVDAHYPTPKRGEQTTTEALDYSVSVDAQSAPARPVTPPHPRSRQP